VSAFGALRGVYRAEMAASLAIMLQYRVSLLIWLVHTLLEPIVMMTLWSAVAQAQGGSVRGYSAGDFATYFLVSMWVSHLTFTWLMFEFERRVRLGEFTPVLLRPVHPIHKDLADNLAYKAVTLVVLLPVTAILAWSYRVEFAPTGREIGLFAVAVALAFWMRFVSGYALALAAFWLTRVSAVNRLYFVLLTFLSGRWVPMALLPEPAVVATWLLPFRWMVAFPTDLVMGRLSESEILIGFGMQLAWCVCLQFVMQWTWSRALRRYTGVGA
jgi:ABC-2 type transport system permease protein